MNYTEVLKGLSGMKLTYEDKWIYWDDTYKHWVVCQRPYGKHKTRVLLTTESESEACKSLLGDEFLV